MNTLASFHRRCDTPGKSLLFIAVAIAILALWLPAGNLHAADESDDDSLGQGNVYQSEGDVYFRTGDYPKALEMYEKALPFFIRANDPIGQGNAYMGEGNVYFMTGDNRNALEMYEKALLFFVKANDPIGQGNVYKGEGDVHGGTGDNLKALEMYEKALPFFVKANDPLGQGNVYQSEGDVYHRTGDNGKAIEMYEKALPFFVKANDPLGQGNVYIGEGDVYHRTGDNGKAIEMYEKALPFFVKANDPQGQGNVYIGEGDVYGSTGDNMKALEMYEKALPFFVKANVPQGQGNEYQSQGNIYFRTGDNRKALEMYEKPLPFFVKANAPLGQGNVYQSEGDVYRTTGDNGKAIEMYEKALPFYVKANDPLGRGNVYMGEGNVYFTTGDNRKALEMYEKALPFFVKANAPLGQGNVYRREGDIYVITGDNGKALEMYEEALGFYTKADNIQSQAFLFFNKALALAQQGLKNETVNAYEEGLALQEKVRKQTGLSEMKKSLMEMVYGVYERATVYMLDNNYHERAFKYAESMKARVFLDQLAEGLVEIEKGVDPELKRLRDSIEERLSMLGKQRSEEARKQNPDATKLSTFQAEIEKQEKDLEEVKKQIRLKNPVYASVQYPEPITVEDLRHKVLRKDEAVLEYLVSTHGVYCFVVTQDGYEAVKLTITGEDLQQKIEVFLKDADITNLDRPNKKTAAELYEALIKPLEPFVRERTLIVIPDGALAKLPFEALVMKTEEGTFYLIEKYRIQYVQSASVLGMLRTQYKQEGVSDRLIGFGDPVYDYDSFMAGKPEQGDDTDDTKGGGGDTLTARFVRSGYTRAGGKLNRLRGSGKEVRTIGELFRANGSEAKTLLRLDAREEVAKSKEMEGYGYIHFSAHGILDAKFQAIALSQIPGGSDDGFLTLNEIMNSRYHAHLVVLSACQTGLGRMERGEGVTGLTRAVMYAGSPAVVVSLWNVSDIGTKKLMEKFYTNMLAKRMSKEEALRAAKLKMLKDSRYRHPFFWSAFVMYGE